MTDCPQSRTWNRLFWMFSMFFGLNYLSCIATVNLLGDPLWCLLVLSIYILVSLLHCKVLRYCFSKKTKGELSLNSLVDELKLLDVEQIPFVIERFLEMDKKRVASELDDEAICDSERCVVCLEERATIQTLPCKHRVICGQCAWGTFKIAFKRPALHTCVVCRGQIRDFKGSLFKNLAKVKWQDVKSVLDQTKALNT